MAYAEVTMDKNAPRGRKKLHHLEVHPTANGGHVVEHHHHPPHDGNVDRHSFGPGDGHEALAHIAKHAKIDWEHEEEESAGSETARDWEHEEEEA